MGETYGQLFEALHRHGHHKFAGRATPPASFGTVTKGHHRARDSVETPQPLSVLIRG